MVKRQPVPTVTMQCAEGGFGTAEFYVWATGEDGFCITQTHHWDEDVARRAVMEGACFWALVARHPDGFRVRWEEEENEC